MLIAGEASGDTLAAELVTALRGELLSRPQADSSDVQPLRTALGPRFFGAGGPRMAAAGVELAFDMTKHSVIGISEALKKYFEFRRMLRQLVKLALKRQPDVIVCVDFHGFNGRFAAAVRRAVRSQRGTFNNWNPKIVQFVSPQVWASRPGRADAMAENLDLLLSIFPFEKAWYAQHSPKLRVEFVGHPMVGRFGNAECGTRNAEPTPPLCVVPYNTVSDNSTPASGCAPSPHAKCLSTVNPPPSMPILNTVPKSNEPPLRVLPYSVLPDSKRFPSGSRPSCPSKRLMTA